MAKKAAGSRKDQKKPHVGSARGGRTNQYRGRRRKSVGSSKPGSDERGKKKWTKA